MDDQSKLANEFYQQAIKSQAIVERYRHFLIRSLPAMLAYLPGYNEQVGREAFEAIAKNIEGETDADILTRELLELNKDGNISTQEEPEFV